VPINKNKLSLTFFKKSVFFDFFKNFQKSNFLKKRHL
jgi:hypothetical protein